MPVIQSPAPEVDTLNAVMNRPAQVTHYLQQTHVILMIDQALFLALIQLKWTALEYKNILIPYLRGLDISMNFLKVLEQHTQDSGLLSVWTESGILGRSTIEHAIAGKNYAKVKIKLMLTRSPFRQHGNCYYNF